MASRDEYADTGRQGSSPKSRESCMMDCDYRAGTLADQKNANPNSVGTASDYAGVTTAANRKGH